MKYILFAIAAFAFTACKSERDKAADQQDAERQAVLAHLTEEVKKFPDSAGIRLRLANAMDSLGLYKEAIAQTDSLIKRDSANNGLWFSKAQLQESSKDTLQAIESYRRAISIYPSVEAQLSLANLYAEKGDPQSLQICQAVAQMRLGRETDSHCDFIAAIYHARTGNTKKALALFDQCINDNYTYMEAYMEKGFIYFEAKNFSEAAKIFQQAITVNNTYADAYYWAAKCNEATGNKKEAIINYQRSLGLDRNLTEAAAALKRLE